MSKDAMFVFIKWLAENAIIPFTCAWGGAFFAYKYMIKQNKDEEKGEVINYLSLVKREIEKAKSLFITIQGGWSPDKQVLIAFMPVTYYEKISPVILRKYISDECIEHIRNIYENVLSHWNFMVNKMQEINYKSGERQQLFQESMFPLINTSEAQYLKACDTVTNAINGELAKLNKKL